MKFTKMHGAGNDYIYIDAINNVVNSPEELSVVLSDRHFGIGSDGLVLVMASDSCDFRMRMFNPDGTESEMCGNASRCVAKFVYDKKMTHKTQFTLETKAGVKYIVVHVNDQKKVDQVTIDMGEPILDNQLIPTKFQDDTVNHDLDVDGEIYKVCCVSMGNPHCVIFTKGVDQMDIATIGKKIENHPMFPLRTNVEFAEILDDNTIRMRVWERGTGETLACGTGACATLVAAVLNNLCKPQMTLSLLGGELQIEWNKESNRVLMTGPAVKVYEGTIDI